MCPPHAVGRGFMPRACQDGVVVNVSASCGRSWVHALAMSGWVSVSASCGRSWVHAPVPQDGLVVSVSASCGRSWVHAPAMSGWLSG